MNYNKTCFKIVQLKTTKKVISFGIPPMKLVLEKTLSLFSLSGMLSLTYYFYLGLLTYYFLSRLFLSRVADEVASMEMQRGTFFGMEF